MIKTANYQLSQWEATDKFSRADFNADNAAIDAALKAANELPYATGSYTGNGSTQTIELGFQPRFVIVTGQSTGAVGATSIIGFTAFSGGAQVGNVLTFGASGFTVTYATQTYPSTNTSGRTYSYVAFR